MEERRNEIIIHRGSHQIGGCATEIRTQKHRIVIDFGANLPNTSENAMTDEELAERVFGQETCDGVLFSHYHGDHVGLYKKIPADIPLYIGSTAKKILEILTKRLDAVPGQVEKGLPRIQSMNCYIPGQTINSFGDIKITPFIVDHSALDSYMFLIEAGGKKILFTGDFREHGIIGEHDRLEKAVRAYIGEVDILVTEGTMLSRVDETNPIRTEADLGRRARELFQANRESVILVSSTNLDSIMQFYHALPWGMDFVCDAYQAMLIRTAMEEKGKYYKAYRPEMIHGKPRKLYIVGSDREGLGEAEDCGRAEISILRRKGFTMLARENKPLFKNFMEKYMTDPLVIYSKWSGYLDGRCADPKIKDFIGDHRMEQVHTSGHACVESIEKLIRLTDPKVIIPMHTECAEEFAKIPAFMPYQDRVRTVQDGEKFLF